MYLFQNIKTSLNEIKEKPFKLERELQKITENNLELIFGLQFVCTEFSVGEFRVDTFAYNPESKAFIIIEYKRDQSFSVIDQGYSYLALLLNNKAEFILQYNEVKDKSMKKSDIDWEASRVIFVANSFTSHQKNAIEFKDLPLELWEARQFDQDIYSYNQIKASKASASVKNISKGDKEITKVTSEIKTFSIDDHIKEGREDARELFEKLQVRILGLDTRLEENIVRPYIGYKIGNKVCVSLNIHKSKINLELFRVEPKDLNDPEKKVTYKKNSMEFYNKHVSSFTIENEEDIEYAMMLVKQVLKKFF